MPANATSSDQPIDRRPIDHKPRVVVTRHLMPSVEQRMCELFDTALNREDVPFTRDRLIAAMQAADVLVPTVTDRIDAGMIEQAGDRLRLIANFGAGTEHIDLAEAAKRKIIVTNTPGGSEEHTSEHQAL